MTYDDLRKFASNDGKRLQITMPFFRHGKYIAADGRILVALDEKPEGWQDCPECGPDCANVLESIQTPPRPAWEHPIPECALPPPEKCATCYGKGHFTKCQDCQGQGNITCSACDCTRDCKKCNQTGEVPNESGAVCEWCGGSGERPATIAVKAYGAEFDNEYLSSIHRHLPPIQTVQESDGVKPTRLNFQGGFCILMPLRSSGYAKALPAFTAEQYAKGTP